MNKDYNIYYDFTAFSELVKYAFNLAWYCQKKTLFNLKCEGAFEGWSRRASETWEQRFTLTSDEIKNSSEVIIMPALNISGESIQEVCSKAMIILEQYKPRT